MESQNLEVRTTRGWGFNISTKEKIYIIYYLTTFNNMGRTFYLLN